MMNRAGRGAGNGKEQGKMDYWDEAVPEMLKDMVAEGLVMDTGKRRDGQILYGMTLLGKIMGSVVEGRERAKDLVAAGLIVDSGRRHKGRIVWDLTPLGKQRAVN
jgi:hypothetical protein